MRQPLLVFLHFVVACTLATCGVVHKTTAPTPTPPQTPSEIEENGKSVIQFDGTWSAPVSLVENLGRLAVGNQLHIVGHVGGQLVHRSSTDHGSTWSAPDVISPADGNYPGMYGGLFSQGDSVYLITSDANMDSSASTGGRQLDFRRSTDNGRTWSSPIRITAPGQSVFRMRILANANYLHIIGSGAPVPDGSVLYFRSTNNGVTWEAPVTLASNLGQYGGGYAIAVDGATVHAAYNKAVNGVGGGPTYYLRSTNHGSTWSTPVIIGENSASSNRQARVQLTAADGRVFACWQREGSFTGAALPVDRLGFNRSSDGGQTWGSPQVLPGDTGIDRNHVHAWMVSGGAVHILFRIGSSTDTDPAGYIESTDYGATWRTSMVAIQTGTLNHPYSLVADAASAYVLTGPIGAMQFARRLLK